MNNQTRWQPFIYGLLIASGISIGIWLRPASNNLSGFTGSASKLDEILHIIREAYVDTISTDRLEENAISGLLTQLDPHSVYMPAEDLQRANEQLDGEFEGIGVEFNIQNDTIMVVSAINGGPSKELGIRSGDRIIAVEGKNVAGTGITNDMVFKLLRGKKGSIVKVTILRPETARKIDYRITRDRIPIYSVDAHLMLDDKTGYIRISRFASTTWQEFSEALKDLKMKRMQQLIIDLRGNPGGYLNAVTQLADEVLADNQLIVYTEGRNQPRQDYRAEKKGLFEQGKLIVLIDEGSASASEILSGAVQDHDRGLIIGRRSFGKGLVQEPFELSDGSALRLTVSRYYTPSGRCIQKPYTDYDAYEHEIYNRLEKGELSDSSMYQIKDTTSYTTDAGRVVYGGGGIMPDIFIAIDSIVQNEFLTAILTANMLNTFVMDWTESHRKQLSDFADPAAFDKGYNENLIQPFYQYALKRGIKGELRQLKTSESYLTSHIKALIARQLFREEGYFRVLSGTDRYIRKAMEAFGHYEELMHRHDQRLN